MPGVNVSFIAVLCITDGTPLCCIFIIVDDKLKSLVYLISSLSQGATPSIIKNSPINRFNSFLSKEQCTPDVGLYSAAPTC